MAPHNAGPLVSTQVWKKRPRNQSKSPLLSLPGELRNKIYAYAFDSASIRNRNDSNTTYPPSDWVLSPDSTPLLFTCQQTYREAQYFRHNFASHDFSLQLSSFLRLDRTTMLLGSRRWAQVCEFRLDTRLIDFLVEQVSRYGRSNWSLTKLGMMQIFRKLQCIVVIDREVKHDLRFLKGTIERAFGLSRDCERPRVIICEPCFGFECAKVPKLKLRTRQQNTTVAVHAKAFIKSD